jgi:hypothetical protein
MIHKEVDGVPNPRPEDVQIDGSIADPVAGQALRDARDLLLERRDDYDTAYRDFRWPRLDAFNWAVATGSTACSRSSVPTRPRCGSSRRTAARPS